MCGPSCAAPEDTAMTCEDCTAGVQAGIDQLLAAETIETIAGIFSDPEGEFCSGAEDVDQCVSAADFVIRNGLPLLASAADGSQFPAVCNAAMEGTCAARRFAKLF